MTYAVIDTNVLVSSFLTSHEDAATIRIVRALAEGRFVILYNDEILSEYAEVLSRGKFHISTEVVEAFVAKIREIGVHSDRVASSERFPDEDDRVFYEVMLSHVDEGARLVSGNIRHFPSSPHVVTPAQFCAILGLRRVAVKRWRGVESAAQRPQKPPCPLLLRSSAFKLAPTNPCNP